MCSRTRNPPGGDHSHNAAPFPSLATATSPPIRCLISSFRCNRLASALPSTIFGSWLALSPLQQLVPTGDMASGQGGETFEEGAGARREAAAAIAQAAASSVAHHASGESGTADLLEPRLGLPCAWPVAAPRALSLWNRPAATNTSIDALITAHGLVERQYDAVESSFAAARELKEASAKQREPALGTRGRLNLPCLHPPLRTRAAIARKRERSTLTRRQAATCGAVAPCPQTRASRGTSQR